MIRQTHDRNLPKPLSIAASLCLSALQGCAWFGDETERAQMLDMPGIEQTIQRARMTLPTDDRWPNADWWTDFNSPALDDLIDAALADNPDLRATEARLNQSQAMVDVQSAELYPTIHANLTFSAQRFSANSTQVKFAGENFRQMLINPLILRYHLDFWGRDKAALQAAIGRAMAVKSELADAKLLLSTTVARYYFDLLANQEKLALARRIVDYREALLKLDRVRVETGLTDASIPLESEIALNFAKDTEAILNAKVELRRHQLAALTSRGPDPSDRITAKPVRLPMRLALPSDLPLRLIAHRPDIVAARLHAEAAAQEIKVAETAFYPDVNLIALTGLHSVSMTDVLMQGSSLAYAVGPSIELPIFEGGRLRANLTYQEAFYDAAVHRYNASVLHAIQEVADALTHWREIETRLTEQRQTLNSAEARERLADSLHRTGLNDRTDWLTARLITCEQRYRLISLENEQLKTAVQLIKALGGGYSETQKDS
ncbi:MAG: efflux transporter outer membrane subunit [Methylomicrobium sp.]